MSKKSSPGPVYVALDSWIYPALTRLVAMGYAPDAEGLAKPWTREQCKLLVDEVADIASRHSTKTSSAATNEEALQLLSALLVEFPRQPAPSAEVRVESLYTRLLEIGGIPLRDSYHFGQTLANDYGRPYEQGTNAITGFSTFATWGRFSGYFRGEYQSANGREPSDVTVRNLLGFLDGVPPKPALPIQAVSHFDPLELYVGARLGGFALTFGKQSQSWGPGEASGFHFTNNAEPMYALRISQGSPIVLPGPLRFLGHVRTQFLIGRLTGHAYPPAPFMNAQKITFQLSEDLEIGFTRSAIFGGVGHPLTTGNILRSFFSGVSSGGTAFGSSNDPGDRRSGFDFVLRVPGLKRYVSFYSDSLADDEPNPLASPHRSAWGPGIYLAQIPGLRKVDLRFETYSTWLYRGDEGGRFIYWNNQYRDAYTNQGNILGSWVGRDARAYSASSNYWWSAQNKISASFRQTKIGGSFLPGGGTQTDISVTGQWQLRRDVLATAYLQYERYFVPTLGTPRNVIVAALQLTLYPKDWAKIAAHHP